jgi:O-antigen biosynthesis protein WbqV
MPESLRIVQASVALAVSLLVLDYILLSPKLYGTFFFGKVTIVLYFVVQTAFLSGTRIAYRYFREARTQRRARAVNAIPALIMGRAADVEVPLRSIESGAVSKIFPVGLLSPARSDQGVTVRGVPVLGGFEDL